MRPNTERCSFISARAATFDFSFVGHLSLETWEALLFDAGENIDLSIVIFSVILDLEAYNTGSNMASSSEKDSWRAQCPSP